MTSPISISSWKLRSILLSLSFNDFSSSVILSGAALQPILMVPSSKHLAASSGDSLPPKIMHHSFESSLTWNETFEIVVFISTDTLLALSQKSLKTPSFIIYEIALDSSLESITGFIPSINSS